MILAFASDYTQHRFLYIVLTDFIGIAGVAILLSIHSDINTQYGAIFLVAIGVYSGIPLAICWFSMNQRGHRKRAVAMGIQIGLGEIGGIISTFLFPKKDAPLWRSGYGTVIAMLGLSVFMSTGYFLACVTENRRAREGTKEPLDESNESFRYWL